MASEIIELDGSTGEGGGQILRTALSLSCVTGKPFKIFNIRSSRPKPGLKAQHLMCVAALKEICSAEVNGAEIDSQTLTFKPNSIRAGNYNFNIGTAGSITLLSQCILPPLLLAGGPSTISFTGGTHVPFAPFADYFSGIFLPTIAKMGANAKFTVEKVGLYPRGGGKVTLKVQPADKLLGLNLANRGELEELIVKSAVCDLPLSIGERQLAGAREKLKEFETGGKIEGKVEEIRGSGQGTFAFISADYGNCTGGFSCLGKIGKKAEQVGAEAAGNFVDFHLSGACVDEHLADQLLLYCALAREKEKSTFTTPKISQHFETNAWTIKQFLDVEINWEKNVEKKKGGKEGENFLVSVG